ncbi:MAG: hypothetical protein SGJ24_03635 [Chloroflexota bacterium]|nr:hypothetical protein [Chloroflexota bacterium]
MSQLPATYLISDHAREEAERREIPLEIVDQVMVSPGQIVHGHSGRMIYQSQIEISGTLYLVRAIVTDADPRMVVMVYRTSKIEKYWSRL